MWVDSGQGRGGGGGTTNFPAFVLDGAVDFAGYRVASNRPALYSALRGTKLYVATASPGTSVEYKVPDMYGRPWGAIWEEYHEAGMERPESDDIFTFE